MRMQTKCNGRLVCSGVVGRATAEVLGLCNGDAEQRRKVLLKVRSMENKKADDLHAACEL